MGYPGTDFAFSVEPGHATGICGIPHIMVEGHGYEESGSINC